MDRNKLKTVVEQEIRTAVGYLGGDVSEERRRAMDYYLGEPFGNEQEGRSQVVSTDVQDTIEAIMPDFMEIFAGGDQVVRFEPQGVEDEAFAEQATDYVNHIWTKDNDGFGVTHDWIKDGLLQKNGIVKIWWEDFEKQTKEHLENVNSLQMQELIDDDDIEVVEAEERPAPEEFLEFAPDGILYDATIVRTEREGRVRVRGLPPEEFLISRRSVSLDDAEFTCHKVRKTVSDLLEEGYDPEVVKGLPSHDTQDYNEERVSRFDDDEWPTLDDSLDPAMREIWLYECYLKVDYDDDGIAEMRQIVVAGPGWQILSNEEVEEHPFETITPIRMPHKFFGRSVADLVMDVQLIKSTIQRQLLDHMYNVNNTRSAINERVDLDDYLTNRPGGAIRVSGMGPVGDSIMPITTAPLGNYAFPLLEYWDSISEKRSGISRLGQGIDPQSINKTATGVNQLLGRTQRRMLLMARNFAEQGFRKAFSKILRIVVRKQDYARVIRLRNEWVPMDPRSWNADMDVTTSVGLGYGTKENQIAMLSRLLEIQERIVSYQGGADGPLVKLDNIHHTARKLTFAMGEKDADAFFADPMDPNNRPPEKGPPPEMLKIQQDGQIEQAKLMEDRRQFDERLKLEYTELQAKYEQQMKDLDIERSRAENEVDKNMIQWQRNEYEAVLKQHEQDAKVVTEAIEGLREIASQMSESMENGTSKEESKEVLAAIRELAAQLARPKKIVRDKNNRPVGIE